MTTAQDTIPSPLPDLAGVPLGTPLEVTGEDYARVMRRIGVDDGAAAVSAFNSSI